jgi:8-oxo-dGTP pyrophosphatase MutT (NUDIX family)
MAIDWRARLRARLRHTYPGMPAPTTYRAPSPDDIPAAVLTPVVDHPQLTMLFTERAADLREHAGQVSFPGGRLEPNDSDPAAAALRETEEEIGLAPQGIEILGYLPDHLVGARYRVTPVVGLVRPGFTVRPDPVEVAGAFEVPFAFLMDPANHRSSQRIVNATPVTIYELSYDGHRIWGATAGMLVTLYHVLTDPEG